MTTTDYACPNCRRVRRRAKRADAMYFKCSCVGTYIECPRVRWELADWRLLNQPLADALGVGVHVIRAKRAKMRRKRGVIGRKPYVRTAPVIDAGRIDPKLSVKANALALGCTTTRIRQLQKAMNQKKTP